MSEMVKFRARIDRLDEQIVGLISERFDICRQVADYKAAEGIPMMQPQRIVEIKNRCHQMGKKYSLDVTFLQQFFEFLIKESCRLEDAIIETAGTGRN